MTDLDQLRKQIAELQFKLMKEECKFPIGHPVKIFDKWWRIGYVKGFEIVNGQPAVVLTVFTKDKKSYTYYVYDLCDLREVK